MRVQRDVPEMRRPVRTPNVLTLPEEGARWQGGVDAEGLGERG